MAARTRNDLLSSFKILPLKLCHSIIKGLAKIDWSFLLYVRTNLLTIEDASGWSLGYSETRFRFEH